MANTEPILYLDTNIILDVLHGRWPASKRLFERIKSEHWECITSRFTMLELVDTEHEECFIENKKAEGYPLSRVRTFLGTRHQKAHALPKRDLEKIHAFLDSHSEDVFAYIDFRYPVANSFWDKAEDYCNSTEIAVADAMHLALAKESGCNILVTRDSDFRTVADDYIITTSPDGIETALAKLNKPNQ